MYQNEEQIGKAIADSSVEREDIFVSSKYYPTRGYEDALNSFERTRSKLGVEYVDLYLIHWPGGGKQARLETWKAFEKLYREGKVKAIGVSNYLESHLDEIQNEDTLTLMPMVNQCEFHLRNQYIELRAYCKFRGIQFMSYMPFGGGGAPILENQRVVEVAQQLGKTPAQVILKWIRNQGIICIPKSTSKLRIAENAKIEDLVISDELNREFCAMNENYHYDWDPNDVSNL
eukprot:CAMPEP_0184006170 /NCGR_PEP_ID=MMETSP0954-20121128/512_1 /TAXON_ID=627963 /ORGANISM="Aplanochytrium sp, Strain PBS07" /LENGTH=230 /DNA_ID=CAMNT_0026284625 /DNA_START=235 /DNA_END=927 /DNA_ORIENTATION=-